ncbi:TraB/GumN family protein [Polaromonas sp. JS666]|uniref:TraB/GumN family protein n=1 Tax=Polaromonas sp. (strain JS666 / ATCC BAA-500) TaxID=296591 RepID=UPI0008879869|nr:TraB/GumN family protein [Polaromonas sp. JS666]SDN87740.1 TraB family protein [Polaromonas sp. JS666]
MLWHVTNTSLHILGSIHLSGTPLLLSEKMAATVERAEVLAFEANLDAAPDPLIGRYKRGTLLSTCISADLFRDTVNLWDQFRFDRNELEGLQPWLAATRLTNALAQQHGLQYAEGIDRKIFSQGKHLRKKLFFLESVNVFAQLMSQSPPIEQERYLSLIVQEPEEEMQRIRQMAAAWKAQRPDYLIPIVSREISLIPRTFAAVVNARNRNWLPQLLRLARSRKNTVAVVGALHMVGPGSLVDLLLEQDFACVRYA